MTSSKRDLASLRRRIRSLSNAKRRDMCWELGHFQAPMLIREPGGPPTKPFMLVCVDTASRAVMGSDLLLGPPRPQDFLSLLVASMENPCVGNGAPILPETVRLGDSAVFKLLGNELGQLGVKVELVEQLSALREFREIAERELFSRQIGYTGRKN